MTYTCKHCGEEVPALTICNCRGALIEHYLEELGRHGWTGLRELTAENADLKRQLAECWAIIDKIDIAAPLADETCLEPGITLSEAVRRQLQATFDNGRSVERSIQASEEGKGELGY